MGIRPGWGMTTTGGLYIETHSLFTRARRRSLPSPRGLGPAARLGRAAAGAGRALRAADAVGCTAVFRGRRGGGHLLPSCCLPCVRIDVPQGPRQERSDHKRRKCDAHHGEGVQAVENCCKEGKPIHTFSESAADAAILYLFHKHCQEGWARTKKMRTE